MRSAHAADQIADASPHADAGRVGDVGLRGDVGGAVGVLLGELEAAVAAVSSCGWQGLSGDELRAVVSGLRRPRAMLDAVLARVIAEVERRAVVAAGPAKAGPAVRDAQAFVADRLGLAPAEVKRAGQTGKRLQTAPRVGAAFDAGLVTAGQSALIAETVASLDPDRRAGVEAELLALASRLSLRQLRDQATRILARDQPAELAARETRQHAARRFTHRRDDDGALVFSGRLYGLLAETAEVAFRAFTRPDTPGESRTPDQRRADGLDALCAAALGSGDAPTTHGVRPHVQIVVHATDLDHTTDWDTTLAQLEGSGPITLARLRPALRDCTWHRLVLGPDSVPIEVSETVRTVPAGLWRALVHRDQGCRWPGCDAPPSWCDVAHGHQPFRHGGKLTLDNATLLCRHHHRRFDTGNWHLTINTTEVTFHRQPH